MGSLFKGVLFDTVEAGTNVLSKLVQLKERNVLFTLRYTYLKY